MMAFDLNRHFGVDDNWQDVPVEEDPVHLGVENEYGGLYEDKNDGSKRCTS